MRNAFAAELLALARQDERITLLSGDIGNRLFDPFKDRFPSRFFNCGIAEQSMIGVAAGMALTGLRPVVYTIAAFATGRCWEQIRVDVCYHEQPVVIVGVGGGLSYASLGATHHACEDIGILRILPGMTVLCPADAHETRAALRAALAVGRPTYIRLGKKGEPVVHPGPISFAVGEALPLRRGSGLAILASGTILPLALDVADALAARGLSPEVASLPSIKPLDVRYLVDVFARCATIVTIEEHSVMGGIGAAVGEWHRDHGGPPRRLVSVGTPDEFLHRSGGQDFARTAFGLDRDQIVARILAP